jgi:hypothetical protein
VGSITGAVLIFLAFSGFGLTTLGGVITGLSGVTSCTALDSGTGTTTALGDTSVMGLGLGSGA